MNAQALVRSIEEMASAGHQRAEILARFKGEDKRRAAELLKVVYEMESDDAIFRESS
jgi:hypothetical protein